MMSTTSYNKANQFISNLLQQDQYKTTGDRYVTYMYDFELKIPCIVYSFRHRGSEEEDEIFKQEMTDTFNQLLVSQNLEGQCGVTFQVHGLPPPPDKSISFNIGSLLSNGIIEYNDIHVILHCHWLKRVMMKFLPIWLIRKLIKKLSIEINGSPNYTYELDREENNISVIQKRLWKEDDGTNIISQGLLVQKHSIDYIPDQINISIRYITEL